MIDYSVIHGYTGSGYGVGNTGGDPLFCSPATDNWRLKTGSAAFDSGDGDAATTMTPADATDVDYDNDVAEHVPDRDHGDRVRGDAIDMGAYERVSPCAGDSNDDQMIGFQDLLAVLSNWGCTSCGAIDWDGNSTIGFGDLLIVLSEWGPCGCETPVSPPESVYECMEKTSDPAEQAACIEAILLTQGG